MSSNDKAVLELKRQRDRLKKYQKQLDVVIARETEMAKELLRKKDKRKAMLCLKKKKYQQQCLEKAEAQLLNLDEMVNAIEYAQIEQKVFEALTEGKDTLQKLNEQTSLEDVEKLMEDTAEAIAYQEELNDVLGGALTELDEEDVLSELADLEEEFLAEEVEENPTATREIKVETTEAVSERPSKQAKTAKAKEVVLA